MNYIMHLCVCFYQKFQFNLPIYFKSALMELHYHKIFNKINFSITQANFDYMFYCFIY